MRSRTALLPALTVALLAACSGTPAPPPDTAKTRATPAKKPALALRAIGTEPGWLAEVDAGPQPKIRLQLDYGLRKMELSIVVESEQKNGYVGVTDDGTVIGLIYKRERCSDGMSDRVYAASAALWDGHRMYQGCAEVASP
ncbi:MULTISPECIES: hypothetical protein [unclassified Lysobacter]|uniref:hypothetical protein n=1 Tax=unclassified Lysobacter TaxID=2635362 RepID=UPI001BEABEE9|nr:MULTISPECIES: hypothetical protein [unclassified Lysobacter]MBT2748891.1 hypothetical protein [Lysobacter sp. ISL-42]MBT2753081.1 hypothetical protein [Lysobacter sp. ISL-50]MBT2777250.1 hypothetical protein [Lysobacter sp. ISL-54]MBT2783230.1 hypothetical protein [Lysobacter sp. ISL-52]